LEEAHQARKNQEARLQQQAFMILAAVILRRKIQEIKVPNVFDARARDIECKIVQVDVLLQLMTKLLNKMTLCQYLMKIHQRRE